MFFLLKNDYIKKEECIQKFKIGIARIRKYKELEKKWMNETKKFKKGILVVIYIILSFLLTLGLAIYSGNKKW